MNKLFIVLLAVCLVSVNCGVVKRDDENAKHNYFDDISKTVQDFAETAKKQFSETLNPDQIKKSFNEGVDTLNKWVADIQKKPTDETKQ